MMDKVIVITGPTAIGKTNISLEIAKAYNAEIINADASQFRKGLDIGTAKIKKSEMIVEHHLFDIIEIEDSFSIKDYQLLVRHKIKELHSKNILPILVGGSGLYINAAIGNYELKDSARNIEVEEEFYSNYNNEELHKILEQLDYAASENIHPNNRRRVLRAIQMAKDGSKISEQTKGEKLIYDALIIQLTTQRELLYERINERFDVMIEEGWLEEIKSLKEQGIDFSNVKDIGYYELYNYLEGKLDFPSSKEIVQRKTRNFAKRQITWFKNKMNTIEVLMDYSNQDKTIGIIQEKINKFLNE